MNTSIRCHARKSKASRLVTLAVALAYAFTLIIAGSTGPRMALANQPPDHHVVQPGESLNSIAALYGIEVEAILLANNLDDPDHLRPGQKLTIPGGTAPVVHRVAHGETLMMIAERYGVNAYTLATTNRLADPDRLHEGQELVIHGAPVSKESGPEAPPPPSVVHVVAPGDTLYGIARRYGVAREAIAAANGLTSPDIIVVGDKLVIPGGVPPPEPPRAAQQTSSRGAKTTPAPQAESPQPITVENGEVFQVTYFCLQGTMASGRLVYYGAAAADASIMGLGTRVAVDGLGIFVIEDRFALDLGQKRIDIWIPNCRQALIRGIEYRKVAIVE